MGKSRLPRDWLYEQYIVLGKTAKNISEETGISKSTIEHRLSDLKIKRETNELINNKEWLYDQYIIQNKTVLEISKEFNLSRDTIAHKLSDFNIHRDAKEHRCKDENWLRYQYITLHKSYQEIALEENISASTVEYYLNKYNIKREPEVLLTKDFLYTEHIIKHKNMLQIAKETGHNNTSIRKYMDLYNIPVWTCIDNTNEYIDNLDGTTSVKIYDPYGNYLDTFIIDTDQKEKVSLFKWILGQDNIVPNRHRYRVMTGVHPSIVLSRYLLNLKDNNLFIDHIDNNPLNNMISNLRIVTRSQNQMNHDIHRNNTSGFTGVCFNTAYNKWMAQLNTKGINYRLSFKYKEDAIYARYIMELILFGKYRSNRNDDNIANAILKCNDKDVIKNKVEKLINEKRYTHDSQRNN